MAKHLWLVTYAFGEDVKTQEVDADYFDNDEGFVTFMEDPDASSGAGGAVFSVLAECVATIERISKPQSTSISE
jgi:hypothetical protein